jgi:hypothetical protein
MTLKVLCAEAGMTTPEPRCEKQCRVRTLQRLRAAVFSQNRKQGGTVE